MADIGGAKEGGRDVYKVVLEYMDQNKQMWENLQKSITLATSQMDANLHKSLLDMENKIDQMSKSGASRVSVLIDRVEKLDRRLYELEKDFASYKEQERIREEGKRQLRENQEQLLTKQEQRMEKILESKEKKSWEVRIAFFGFLLVVIWEVIKFVGPVVLKAISSP